MEQSNKTVIGLFENKADANKAAQFLSDMGISRTSVDVARGTGGSFDLYERKEDDTESENGIIRFFKNLFGVETEDADRYSHVGSKGHSIVTVHAQNANQAKEVVTLLDDCGAIDVEEKAGASKPANVYGEAPQTTVRSRIVEKSLEENSRLR